MIVVCLASALSGGCRPQAAPEPPDAQRLAGLKRQRADLAEQWAQTLTRLRPYEKRNLDREMAAVTGQVAEREAELERANKTVADLETQCRSLLAQMEVPAPDSQPATGTDWAGRLDALRLLLASAQLNRVQVERRLVEAREEHAQLRRQVAQRDFLVRQAADQERRLRELDGLLGP